MVDFIQRTEYTYVMAWNIKYILQSLQYNTIILQISAFVK